VVLLVTWGTLSSGRCTSILVAQLVLDADRVGIKRRPYTVIEHVFALLALECARKVNNSVAKGVELGYFVT